MSSNNNKQHTRFYISANRFLTSMLHDRHNKYSLPYLTAEEDSLALYSHRLEVKTGKIKNVTKKYLNSITLKNQLEIWVDIEGESKFYSNCISNLSAFRVSNLPPRIWSSFIFNCLIEFCPPILLAVLWNLFDVTQFCYSRGSS